MRLAEKPLTNSVPDQAIGSHGVYMADHMVEIANAKAGMRYAEDQRALLARQRADARLDARTHEADRARGEADMADEAAARASLEATN